MKGLWYWIRSYFSTNGFDAEEHEKEVQEIKDETEQNWNRVGEHLDKIGDQFREVDESFGPDDFPERPVDPGGSRLCEEGSA